MCCQDKYNYSYDHSINEKPINVDYSVLAHKIKANHNAPKFKVNDRVRTTKTKVNSLEKKIPDANT